MLAIRTAILAVLAGMASAVLEHQITEKLSPEVDQEETSTSVIAMEQSQSALMAIADQLGSPEGCPRHFDPAKHLWGRVCPWPASADSWGNVYHRGNDMQMLFFEDPVEDYKKIKSTDNECEEVPHQDSCGSRHTWGFRCDDVRDSSAPFQHLKYNIYDVRAYKTRVGLDRDAKKCNSGNMFCCGKGKWVTSAEKECNDDNIRTSD